MFIMFLKYFHRSSVLLLVPGMVMANQSVPTINWQACHPESGLPFLCGSAEVPLDYNAPDGGKLSLALIKLPATASTGKIGSLFYNPGGPGGSGVDFVLSLGKLLSPDIRANFDVIGFDPRGVAGSSPLVCFNAPVTSPQFYFPQNPAEEALKENFDKTMASACKTNGGSVLDHMSTANVARDLDLLRQAVGDSQLNYVGYSYGSFLGVTYANLFPDKIRAMVLDGVVDPIAWTTGYGNEGYNLPVTTRTLRDEGMQATLDEFFRLCDQAGAQCSFGTAAASRFDFLVNHLRTTPVHMVDPVNGPFDLTYDRFIATVFSALANSSTWSLLASALNEIQATIITGSEDTALKAGTAFSALTAALGSAPSPDDLAVAAQQFSVMCSDTINPDNYAAWSSAGEAADANGGIFGRITAWQSSPCAVWQGNDPDRYLGPFTQTTTEPILLVANRFDPITPYGGAEKTHSLLPNSTLLTVEGWGHTSLLLSSCVDQAVSNYLLTSKISSAGASCQQDATPFTNTSANPISFVATALAELITYSGNTPTDPARSGATTPADPPSSGATTSALPISFGTTTPADPISSGATTSANPISFSATTFDPISSSVIPLDPTSSGPITLDPITSGAITLGDLMSSGATTPVDPTSSGATTPADPACSVTTSPGTTSPGTTSPGATSPGTTSPGTTSPGATSPGATSPGKTSPGATSPKDNSSNTNQEQISPNGTPALAVFKTFTIYDPATGTVTIPAVQVGDKVEYVNVKLGLNPEGTLSVLSSEAPDPKSPVVASATYDSAIGEATIPEVLVNGKTEFINVKLKSNPDGTFSILSTEKPSIAKTYTIYDPATNTVTIPAVQIGDKVEFANVKLGLNPGEMLSVLSSEVPDLKAPVVASATYDSATGGVTIPDVLVNGKTEFINVKLKSNPDGTFSILSTEKPPVS